MLTKTTVSALSAAEKLKILESEAPWRLQVEAQINAYIASMPTPVDDLAVLQLGEHTIPDDCIASILSAAAPGLLARVALTCKAWNDRVESHLLTFGSHLSVWLDDGNGTRDENGCHQLLRAMAVGHHPRRLVRLLRHVGRSWIDDGGALLSTAVNTGTFQGEDLSFQVNGDRGNSKWVPAARHGIGAAIAVSHSATSSWTAPLLMELFTLHGPHFVLHTGLRENGAFQSATLRRGTLTQMAVAANGLAILLGPLVDRSLEGNDDLVQATVVLALSACTDGNLRDSFLARFEARLEAFFSTAG